MENIADILGKLFMIGIPGTSLNEENKRILQEIKPGTIILFSRNIQNKYQINKFIDDIKNFLGYEPLFAIDQEGGMVTRLTNGFSIAPSAMAIAATQDKNNAYIAANILAQEMEIVGINWNFAPVVDINNNPLNSVIGIRSFSDKKEIVVEYAEEFVRGLHEGGVLSCLKHFPGIGNVNIDPHMDLTQSDLTKEQILSNEVYPYLAISSPSWMPTHVYMPKIQSYKEPVTLSKEMLTNFVRKELKYEGILVADDFEMGGIDNFYKPEDSALKALDAGMDIITFCHTFDKQLRAKEKVVNEYKNSNDFKNNIKKSLERIDEFVDLSQKIKNAYIGLDNIGCEENIHKMQEITDRSITIVNHSEECFPLLTLDNVFYYLTPKKTMGIEDRERENLWIFEQLSQNFKAKVVKIPHFLDTKLTKEIMGNARNKINIIFTENAYLNEEVKRLISLISNNSKKSILVALKNPYDAFLTGIKYSLCSYGYNMNSQISLYKVLMGEIQAEGILPIDWRAYNV